jgi:hypothetical protein
LRRQGRVHDLCVFDDRAATVVLGAIDAACDDDLFDGADLQGDVNRRSG